MSDRVKVITDPGQLPTGYCQMFALSWFLYDYALTFDDEVRYIWSRRIKMNSILFLVTRYFTGLLLVMSAITCTVRGFSQTVNATSSIGLKVSARSFCLLSCKVHRLPRLVLTDLFTRLPVILQSRIYIMYDRSRVILKTNIGLCILEVIIAGVILALYFGHSTRVIVPSYVLGSCFSERQPKMAAVWAAPLAFESYLAFLAVRKLTRVRILEGGSLLDLMIRDNIVYFFIIVLAMMVNLFMTIFTGLNPGVSVITVVHAAGAVGGTRIVLSLLKTGDESIHLSSNTESPPVTSGFDFRPRTTPAIVTVSSSVSDTQTLNNAPWIAGSATGASQWRWDQDVDAEAEAGALRKDSMLGASSGSGWARYGSTAHLVGPASASESSRRGSGVSDSTRRGSVPLDKTTNKVVGDV
ncbi:hypothetical protein EXIGLDRAFT_485049 [Exidia glandulosa HHB12029]|uniref:DUF6533 domain-containing protein n=1 Tax=Exidia glandulosa HHB12029 TaxID=1314781 RepID=A0A165PKZ0_EXIGL|nr:hypothetical protein EXIGLDRAFT_485049 [Exidia glandulosa HHB12029]